MVAPTKNDRLFDIRTVRRNVRSGLITKERYDEWLKTLPDAADNAVPLTLEDEGHRRREVTSPTRPAISAPFDDDDDDDDDIDDEDDLDDEDEDEADEVVAAPTTEAAGEPAAEPGDDAADKE